MKSILLFCACLSAATAGARGDVYATLAGGSTPSPGFLHFSDTGATLPRSGSYVTESFDGLAISGTTVYAATNSLGAGAIATFDGVTGAAKGTLTSNDSASSYAEPSRMAFGLDDVLYATSNRFASFRPNSVTGVLKFNVSTGAYLGVALNLGNASSDFVSDVAFAPNGSGFVSEGGRVLRLDGTVTGQSFINPGAGGLNSAGNIAVGSDGNLYVINSGASYGGVLRFNASTGAFIDTFVSPTAGNIGSAVDLVFNNGDLLMTNGGDSIYRYSATTGNYLGVLATATGSQLSFLAAAPTPEPATLAILAIALIGRRASRPRRPAGYDG